MHGVQNLTVSESNEGTTLTLGVKYVLDSWSFPIISDREMINSPRCINLDDINYPDKKTYRKAEL